MSAYFVITTLNDLEDLQQCFADASEVLAQSADYRALLDMVDDSKVEIFPHTVDIESALSSEQQTLLRETVQDLIWNNSNFSSYIVHH